MPSSSGLLVNDSEDINELCQYLFNTCSNDFVDLFKIIYIVPLESDSSCPFYNYTLKGVPELPSGQKVISIWVIFDQRCQMIAYPKGSKLPDQIY